MSASVVIAALIGLIIGGLVGILAATWRGRRKREALHLELAVVRAQVKTDEQIDREREAALNQSIERLRSTFDSVAGQSMRSNSELFLKLARWARAAALSVEDIAGLAYDPFQNSARQSNDVDVNYMMHLRSAGDSE